MIRIEADPERGTLSLRGHACYAPKGQDIVCAGVTAIAAAMIDMVQSCGSPDWVRVGEQEEILVRMPADAPRTEGLDMCLMMAITGWMEIQEDFPDHVQIVLPENEQEEKKK